MRRAPATPRAGRSCGSSRPGLRRRRAPPIGSGDGGQNGSSISTSSEDSVQRSSAKIARSTRFLRCGSVRSASWTFSRSPRSTSRKRSSLPERGASCEALRKASPGASGVPSKQSTASGLPPYWSSACGVPASDSECEARMKCAGACQRAGPSGGFRWISRPAGAIDPVAMRAVGAKCRSARRTPESDIVRLKRRSASCG